MKLNVEAATNLFYKGLNKCRKNSPEIFLVAGVLGVIGTTVMACRATAKLEETAEKGRERIEAIHETAAELEIEPDQKELAAAYAKTGLEVIKLYAPTIAMGGLSIGCILASHNILKKRNVALGAAYTAIDKSFKEYRNRVVTRFGEDVDRELRYNLKSEKREVTETDPETGKEKKVKKAVYVVNPSDISAYARFFEKYTVDNEGNSIANPYWNTNNEYNLMFLKAQERYANDLLRTKKILFLNDVYEMLGLPKTKAGQVVGWVYNPENPVGDNYVSFGMYTDNLSYSDFANGYDPAILLDFNVDGNVWELM